MIYIPTRLIYRPIIFISFHSNSIKNFSILPAIVTDLPCSSKSARCASFFAHVIRMFPTSLLLKLRMINLIYIECEFFYSFFQMTPCLLSSFITFILDLLNINSWWTYNNYIISSYDDRPQFLNFYSIFFAFMSASKDFLGMF